ncbi:MAG: bifunctional UDP-3-O-[3-hydroxymyristoyl] N-acetylglucosamine deacetylase/3-hydroxyacyl-ACP dehydratase [Bacteroidales bacterium]|jgi:UDP-3-O-[3-hydroxymyristoyl] N-acetylglucosamine deacetylase/3-hydroxyacyl-[acyl-carrier-protein] dehydratase|nr:bifunctional UDP-3-O-[3-hydroxymyristoyl] N-acetylglucosamine deacetylase/3-hydroxyacyl-ACP dehydratase [Bacteroidales bacterium]
MKQRTLNKIVSIEGRGLHSGKHSHVNLVPSTDNTGVCFKRIDIENNPVIPALATFVTDTTRGTTLTKNNVSISTIEHLVSALYAKGIDNVIVEVDCEEVPILDGSSKYWLELIDKAGIKELESEKQYYEIKQTEHFLFNDDKIEYWVMPSEEFKVSAIIDFNSDLIGTQMAELTTLSDFDKEIANCRTFVFLSEIEGLVEHNYIKGGDLDNAIIFVDKVLSQDKQELLAKFFNKNVDDLKVERGVLNNTKLLFNNEPARHKLLDFIGDISLMGKNVKGHFIIKRPGHTTNTEIAKKLKNIMDNKDSIPVYDPNKEPVFDITEIKKRLPHRFPMLLIDKVIEVGEDYVVGLKNVTGNEDFFNGHFPEEPVMPGVLVVEALGQTGGMLVLKDKQVEERYNTYFMKFEEVKFRNKVVPGDTLILKLSLLEPIRRGVVRMKGIAYVGNKVVVEATMMAKISKAE